MGKDDRRIGIRIRSDDPIWQQIEDAARRENKSKNQIILNALRRGLEKTVPMPLAPKLEPETSGYSWMKILLILLMVFLGAFGLFLYVAQIAA